jgi:restriction system protein
MAKEQYNPDFESAAETRARETEERRNARLQQQAHVRDRMQEAEDENQDTAAHLQVLESLLVAGVASARPLDFASLKVEPEMPVFDAQGQDQAAPEPGWVIFEPRPDGFVTRLMPGSAERRAAKVAAARQVFEAKHAEWADYEQKRTAWLADAKARHMAEGLRVAGEAKAQQAGIDDFEAAYRASDPDAIQQYFSIVIDGDELPEGFPHTVRVAYVKESRQLVVERELPTVDVVPKITTYRYVKANDAITTSARPAPQIKEIYLNTVARVALRTVYLMFAADSAGDVDSLVLNCFVDTVSPETGQRVTPCLLTVRTTRDVLASHDLTRVDAISCLKHLNAEVSAQPHELKAVRPIVNFKMVDRRFVDKTDVLSELDQRPNLAELTPQQFEGLITNLFDKMGLETRLTQASRDSGVDCVAWDMRPVIGGKVVVQAKRYKHTVGVSAVRDLYGTVLNEGAAKGILVSTSGYGSSSVEFAQNKPLQLIAGGELIYLLEEHTGIRARIEFPEEWVDPVPDMVEAGVPVITVKPPAEPIQAQTVATPVADAAPSDADRSA